MALILMIAAGILLAFLLLPLLGPIVMIALSVGVVALLVYCAGDVHWCGTCGGGADEGPVQAGEKCPGTLISEKNPGGPRVPAGSGGRGGASNSHRPAALPGGPVVPVHLSGAAQKLQLHGNLPGGGQFEPPALKPVLGESAGPGRGKPGEHGPDRRALPGNTGLPRPAVSAKAKEAAKHIGYEKNLSHQTLYNVWWDRF